MACGARLGILLICLAQAEHARCSRLTEAPSSWGLGGGGGYVGFSQQTRGARGLEGLVPQNRHRQPFASTGSARSGRVGTQAADGGFTRGLPASDPPLTLSRRAPEHHAFYRSLQSGSASKAKRQPANRRGDASSVVKARLLNLRTPVSSGRSASEHQNGLFSGHKTAWLVQQPRGFLLGNGVSAQSLPGERLPFTSASQSRAPRPGGSAAETPGRGQSSAGVPTLACGLGRRVSSRRHSGSPRPFRFHSLQNAGPQVRPSQRKPNQSYLFPASAGGRSEPSSSTALSCEGHPRGSSYGRNVVRPETREDEGRLSAASGRASWTNRNRLSSGSGGGGVATSARRYAPTRTYAIPKHLGANAIRRLKRPDDRKEASAQKPQQTSTRAPRRPALHGPQVKWYRIGTLH